MTDTPETGDDFGGLAFAIGTVIALGVTFIAGHVLGERLRRKDNNEEIER